MSVNGKDIVSLATSLTRKWTKQRKAEERDLQALSARKSLYVKPLSFLDVADRVLPAGYAHASGDGQFPVSKRQLFYACRDGLREQTGQTIKADYFSQTLLVRFVHEYPEITADWKITADPRGTLLIPNAAHEVRVPVGTLAIDEHLAAYGNRTGHPDFREDLPTGVDIQWPSLAAGQRYQGVLSIEKEGFEPLLEEARIAERFDLAILSCKGHSVVAARKFVDRVCGGNRGIPLFVAHDFDKAGFEISQSLTRVSNGAMRRGLVKYEFEHEINVIDIGLRLADVRKYKLQSEWVEFKGHFEWDSPCTAEEQKFLRSNRRVELNAFTSPQFIEWLEAKLRANGLGKRLIPEDRVLAEAFRRATIAAEINANVAEILARREDAESIPVPATLRRQLTRAMRDSDEPWDTVLYQMVEGAARTR